MPASIRRITFDYRAHLLVYRPTIFGTYSGGKPSNLTQSASQAPTKSPAIILRIQLITVFNRALH